MIKLVISDMDGTFLDENGNISHENLLAIQKLKKHNIDFCICTGRMFGSALLISDSLDNSFPVISSNGAYVKNPRENVAIVNADLGQMLANKIISTLEKFEVAFHFYNHDTIYSNQMVRAAKKYHDEFLDLETKPIKVIVSGQLKNYTSSAGAINKFIIFEKDPFQKNIIINALSEIEGIDITASGVDNIEVMGKGVSKGSAVSKIKEIYNLSRNEVMVLGDQLNDMSMFKEVDFSVAVENAVKEVKDIAFYVTKSNLENGFAHAVDAIIFGEGE